MDSAALLRYLDGQLPASERQSVEAWLAASEANRAELERLRAAWELAGRAPHPEFDIDRLWNRLRQQLDDVGSAPETRGEGVAVRAEHDARPTPAAAVPGRGHADPFRSRPSTRWRRARFAFAGIAAALALLVVGRAQIRGGGAVDEVDEGVARSLTAYTTRPGETAEHTLSDGTHVVLSGATTLMVPSTFGDGARDVFLDGAAYFDVTHDAENVFRVHTGKMVAEDMGTRFSVIAYAADPKVEVAVAEGVVGVAGRDGADVVVLNPNDVAHVSEDGEVRAERNVDVQRYFSWMEGRIEFDQARVIDAAQLIKRRFGIEVRVADAALAERRFTGTVSLQTLYDDLRALALLLDAKLERDGQDVTLSAPRRARR